MGGAEGEGGGGVRVVMVAGLGLGKVWGRGLGVAMVAGPEWVAVDEGDGGRCGVWGEGVAIVAVGARGGVREFRCVPHPAPVQRSSSNRHPGTVTGCPVRRSRLASDSWSFAQDGATFALHSPHASYAGL